jgi:hypothetical protein
MVFDALSNAKNVSLDSTLQTSAGSTSSFDPNDYYRFQLNSSSNAYFSLNSLSADANLTLLSSNGQQLLASTQKGTSAEAINVGLSAGTYYIKVSQSSGNTLYNLSFSSQGLFANINDSAKFFAGDFNGDNRQDVIRQEQGSSIDGWRDTQFYLGLSTGGYSTGVDISNMNTVAGNVANLVVGDFNGDGRDDLIRQEFGSYVNGVSDTQILSFQNGNFQLVGNIANMLAFNGNLTNLIAGDFNQDGRMDLLRQEKGAWANGQGDVEIYLSTGGWNFGASQVINNANIMTGDNTRLVTSGADIMRLEFGSLVNGVNDVNFTTFANGNLQALQSNPTVNFTNAIVAKPWEASIGALYTPNASQLGTLVSNQATLISPLGTTGRYSAYASGAMIQWSAKTGAVLISAAMANIYKPQGDAGSWLGFATGKEYAYQGGIRQDFEGGYLFKDANQAVALRPNQTPNFAPTGLLIQGLQLSYNTNSMLQLSTSYAGDSNGWNDVAKVDFWLTNTQGQRVELADATSFTLNTTDFWASFQYGTNLSGIAAGNYTFRAVVYDKAGLAGASFSQAMSIVMPNAAPIALQIYGLQTSYDANSTLTVSSGFVWDANGWSDAAKVDFWLTNSQGQRIELADVTSFSSYDANFAKFGYSTSLSGLGAGSYKLCAISYDKAGLGSNTIAQDFKIVAPNVAPSGLLIYGLQSSYNTNTTLQLSTSYAGDSNGWNDVAKVDFWLTNAQGQRVELADATSFSLNSADFWASFQYGTSLSGIGAGAYTFRAVVYDKAGVAGASFSQAMSIVAPNLAPTNLQIQGLQTSYDANSTLTLGTGFVWDANGWADTAKVDFWLTNSQGQRLELADVTSFSSHDANYAKFNYSTSLAGLGAGNYKLCAIAYDKAGAGSNAIAQDFSILRTRDWFDINLKDANVANLARNAATDRDLSRNDMLSIFRDIEDGGIIDSAELSDMKTLVDNATGSLFSMQAHVLYLASKVVSETASFMQSATSIQSTTFDYGVMGKWFLGTVLPNSRFIAETTENGIKKYTRHDFTYQTQTGSLFGNSNQARISSIDQRSFGDCVLLASLGATFSAQNNDFGQGSSIINSMLVDNGDQTYTVRFFEKDSLQAQWVTVDRRLAFENGVLFGASAQDGLWMPLLEKAYAQWREWNEGTAQRTGWEIMGNGDNLIDGLRRITGRAAKSYFTGSSQDFSFDTIRQAVSAGKSITAASALGASYLVESHAYSVTNAYVSDSGERRVVVRNPWGIDTENPIVHTTFDNSNDGFLNLSYEQFRSFKELAIA